MSQQIARLMGCQRGLVLRRQVLAAGVDPLDVARAVRSGEWVVVRRGVYTTGSLWDSLDLDGRQLLRGWAASLNMSMPHVLSHESAALAHEMAILRSPSPLVHITRFGHIGCRNRHGVSHHQAPFQPWQVVEVRGVPTLDRARTAIDVARQYAGPTGMRHGLAACDSAMRAGVSRHELRTALEPMENWPNVTVARACATLADPQSDGVAESLARLLVVGLGIGRVHTQFGFREGRRTAWVDLRVGRHLIEVDGKVKYLRADEGGFAGRDPSQVVWDEKNREDWLRGHDLGMSRLTWPDLLPSAWVATGRRLRDDVARTEHRWGHDLTDLAPYVVTSPRPRRPADLRLPPR